MPVFRIRCRYDLHYDLFVEAPSVEALDAVVDREGFDPEDYPNHEGIQWCQMSPIDIEPTSEKPRLRLEGSGDDADFVVLTPTSNVLRFPG
jgi:hypothetical protein